MFTLILAVGYDVCSNKVLFLRPILIMKGKNDLKKAERAQYSPEVDVLVQEKAVNDSSLMVSHILPLYRCQSPSHWRAFVLDSARQHITKSVIHATNDGTDFHTRVVAHRNRPDLSEGRRGVNLGPTHPLPEATNGQRYTVAVEATRAYGWFTKHHQIVSLADSLSGTLSMASPCKGGGAYNSRGGFSGRGHLIAGVL